MDGRINDGDSKKSRQRHKNMVANKSRGTRPELLFGKLLWNAGVRYRKNDHGVKGTPDFTVRKYRVAIFCDGEFWHGRNWETRKKDIKSNRDYWYPKIDRNIKRDKEVNSELSKGGWKVFRFWESELKNDAERCLNEVLEHISCCRNSGKGLSLVKTGGSLKVIAGIKDVSEMAKENERLAAMSFSGILAEPGVKYSSIPKFSFADIFTGIGTFSLALRSLGGKCVFASEPDAVAKKIYYENFGAVPFDSVLSKEVRRYIPEYFDVLCASLPCQAFPLGGKRPSLEGCRGTFFYEVAKIIDEKRPKAFILAFDRNMLTRSHGKAIETVRNVLSGEGGYFVPEALRLAGQPDDVPTSLGCRIEPRRNIFVYGFRKDLNVNEFKLIDAAPDFPGAFKLNISKTECLRLHRVSVSYAQAMSLASAVLGELKF